MHERDYDLEAIEKAREADRLQEESRKEDLAEERKQVTASEEVRPTQTIEQSYAITDTGSHTARFYTAAGGT